MTGAADGRWTGTRRRRPTCIPHHRPGRDMTISHLTTRRRLAVAAVAAITGAGLAVGATPAAAATWAPTATRALTLANATPLGAAPSTQALRLTVGLAPRDRAGLDTLIRQQATPGSAEYGQYLTPAQFTSRFAATSATADAVRQYLVGQGMQNVTVAANRLQVTADASVAAAQKAFNTKIASFRQAGGPCWPTPRPRRCRPRSAARSPACSGSRRSDRRRRRRSSAPKLTGYYPKEFNTVYHSGHEPGDQHDARRDRGGRPDADGQGPAHGRGQAAPAAGAGQPRLLRHQEPRHRRRRRVGPRHADLDRGRARARSGSTSTSRRRSATPTWPARSTSSPRRTSRSRARPRWVSATPLPYLDGAMADRRRRSSPRPPCRARRSSPRPVTPAAPAPCADQRRARCRPARHRVPGLVAVRGGRRRHDAGHRRQRRLPDRDRLERRRRRHLAGREQPVLAERRLADGHRRTARRARRRLRRRPEHRRADLRRRHAEQIGGTSLCVAAGPRPLDAAAVPATAASSASPPPKLYALYTKAQGSSPLPPSAVPGFHDVVLWVPTARTPRCRATTTPPAWAAGTSPQLSKALS